MGGEKVLNNCGKNEQDELPLILWCSEVDIPKPACFRSACFIPRDPSCETTPPSLWKRRGPGGWVFLAISNQDELPLILWCSEVKNTSLPPVVFTMWGLSTNRMSYRWSYGAPRSKTPACRLSAATAFSFFSIAKHCVFDLLKNEKAYLPSGK